MGLDIKKVKEEAQKEHLQEREEVAKERIKYKLQELDTAKKVVKNIEREIEDLEDELSQD